MGYAVSPRLTDAHLISTTLNTDQQATAKHRRNPGRMLLRKRYPLSDSAPIFSWACTTIRNTARGIKLKSDIKNASENAEDATRLRKELDEKLINVANTLAAAVTANEVNKVFGLIAREVDVHRKAAETKGDKEYSSYLGSRLRRITDIKTERLAALTAAQEQTA